MKDDGKRHTELLGRLHAANTTINAALARLHEFCDAHYMPSANTVVGKDGTQTIDKMALPARLEHATPGLGKQTPDSNAANQKNDTSENGKVEATEGCRSCAVGNEANAGAHTVPPVDPLDAALKQLNDIRGELGFEPVSADTILGPLSKLDYAHVAICGLEGDVEHVTQERDSFVYLSFREERTKVEKLRKVCRDVASEVTKIRQEARDLYDPDGPELDPHLTEVVSALELAGAPDGVESDEVKRLKDELARATAHLQECSEAHSTKNEKLRDEVIRADVLQEHNENLRKVCRDVRSGAAKLSTELRRIAMTSLGKSIYEFVNETIAAIDAVKTDPIDDGDEVNHVR